ncbi:MAG TPA: hypothetical protein VHO69_03920 [Phototrophicaceae bacterium]|nr:hypothetical protein [Phototrophicaceae bacterium]
MADLTLTWCISWILLTFGIWSILYFLNSQNTLQKRITRLKIAADKETPLLLMIEGVSCGLIPPAQKYSQLQSSTLLITPSRFVVYDTNVRRQLFSFTPEQLQWIGLDDHHYKGFNHGCLHIEKDGMW